MKLPHFIISTIFLLFSSQAFAQHHSIHSIDSLLQLKKPRSFNGVVLLTHEGKEIYKRSYGWNDFPKKTPLQTDDQFLVGSISKQFTAVLILQEIQAGHIQANQTIRHYLPDFEQQWADSVTVQQLLNHTSGTANGSDKLLFKPGTRFSYSNLNYEILGRIVEKTTGKTYEELTASLFKACGMNNSTVPPGAGRKSKATRLVKGHMQNERGKYVETNILPLLGTTPMDLPAAGMVSTAADLTKWLYCLHTGKLLADSTYQMMINNAVQRPHRWGDVKYGDGIQVSTLNGLQELTMNGYVPGFISTMIYYPATKVSIVILENISPNPEDMNKVYFFHDRIREMLKNYN